MAIDKAVLLMAYGTPDRLDDVEAYFTHIRGGRKPAPEAVENLRMRYERVGGGTPLKEITERVRGDLEKALAKAGQPHRVYMGMKHWHPYIAESMQRMRDDGVREVTCVALAPHYSKMSVGAYHHAVDEAHKALGQPFAIRKIDRWHRQPRFITMTADAVRSSMFEFPEAARRSVTVAFTAHSLPVRIREWGDPYEAELSESAAQVAQQAGIGPWLFAWQSAGGSHEPWIGPDILETLETLASQRVKNVLQVPIGFVCDHLEVLYDIDIEAKEKARSLNMNLVRTELPNAKPEFIKTLVDVVVS